ncbi:hypothetical protein ACFSKW_20465 [Nonomuraea mangrovi]|uniref:Uncharacterized protein n=1 Tax=Nonomuraea mangrovi TaxID=2316207 RepID=A0ABW4SZW6_9ACTN
MTSHAVEEFEAHRPRLPVLTGGARLGPLDSAEQRELYQRARLRVAEGRPRFSAGRASPPAAPRARPPRPAVSSRALPGSPATSARG